MFGGKSFSELPYSTVGPRTYSIYIKNVNLFVNRNIETRFSLLGNAPNSSVFNIGLSINQNVESKLKFLRFSSSISILDVNLSVCRTISPKLGIN